MKEITLKKATAKGRKGSIVPVWHAGEELTDKHVDEQRALQWIEDGVAYAGRPRKKAKKSKKKASK